MKRFQYLLQSLAYSLHVVFCRAILPCILLITSFTTFNLCVLFLLAILSLDSILERYHRHYEEDASTSMNVGAADSNSEYFKFNHLSHAELVRLVERQLEGPNLQKLSLTELVQLEKRLHATLAKTRARKTELMFESIMTLQDKEKKLSKEKELLAKEEKKLRKENELLAKEIAELTKNGSREANPAVNTTLNLL